MAELEKRLKLILNEYERVPTAEEIEKVYGVYSKEFGEIPQGAKEVIEFLGNESSRKRLEENIQIQESPIQLYQENAMYQVLTKKKVVFPFGTGTGKTLPAIGAYYVINRYLRGQGKKEIQAVAITPKTNNLKYQWATRINKYSKNPGKIVIIDHENYTPRADNVSVISNIKDVRNNRIKLGEADFAIINYHLVNKWKDFLPERAYGIRDESHNHKYDLDPKTISAAIKEYIRNKCEWASFLTATPMPKHIKDIEHQIRQIHEDSNFRFPRDIRKRPFIIHEKAKDYLVLPAPTLKGRLFTEDGKEIKLNKIEVPIVLNQEHLKFYDRVHKAKGEDLMRYLALREASFDPELLSLGLDAEEQTPKADFIQTNNIVIPDLDSNRIYDVMRNIVTRKFSDGEKTVVFSDYITLVGNKVKNILDKSGVPTLVYEGKNKELKRTLFQIEPEIGAFFGTSQSISEGASYNSANNGINLNPFFEHRLPSGSYPAACCDNFKNIVIR